MERKLIPWNGRTYPAVELCIFPDTDRELHVTVSTEELQSDLASDSFVEADETYFNMTKEASEIDDQIIFYVNKEQIKLPESQIRDIVENAIS